MNAYQSEYKSRLTTAADAIEPIANGETIVYGMSVSQPPALLAALADRARDDKLHGIRLYSFLPLKHALDTVLDPYLADCIQNLSWFVGGADRNLIKTGLTYHVPTYLHQIPRLCRDFMEIDTVITTVSPMDKAGYFTFGTANDYISTATRHCKRLIVEVNENMPRVFGESLLHVSEVDLIVENTVPLIEMPPPDPRPEDEIIGPMLAEMVPDGATIQLGIGGLPNAITRYLTNHKDIGVHTELLTEGMIDLIEKGVITGKRKNLHPRKNVFTTASGTRRMYEFMDDNPSMESYPASYVCSPTVIARNDNMIAVNAILEVDLLGQANAEYLGGTTYSGTGGQLDFIRGAFDSRGGKAILTFYSTAKGGKLSRIVPQLKQGSIVTTPRNDAFYLVTEYGVANLKGKSTKERALAIINLAHPRYREELMREAENMYII